MAEEKVPLLEVEKERNVDSDGAEKTEDSEKGRIDNEHEEKKKISKRRWSFLLICIAFCLLLSNIYDYFAPKPTHVRVQHILRDTPLIDGHNDLPIVIRHLYHNHINHRNFSEPFTNGDFPGHVDIPRLSGGRVGGTFWSVYAPCPVDGMDFSDANYVESIKFTFEQVDLMSRLQRMYPGVFSEPPNGTTALDAYRSGKIISPYGMEGLHSIGNSFSVLRTFYKLGVRYATLTHNCHNIFADAALQEFQGKIVKAEPVWHGVSERGKDLVYEMNRIGMIVDISHVSHETMRDVLGAGKDDWRGSRAPVIFSHSSAYSVCPHPRNVEDDVLQLVKETDSLVMINFAPQFVSCKSAPDRVDGLPDFYPANSTLEHVVGHIMHIGELVGYEHVGFGSDFDGIGSTPTGLEDVSKFPDLVAALLKRGVSDEDVKNVVGGNLIRVWKKVDEVALEMQSSGALPVEDDQKISVERFEM